MLRRRDIGTGALAVILVVSCGLPWVQIGTRSRSSFALLGAIRRLGILHSAWTSGVLAAWPLVPLVGSIVVALVLLGYRRVAALAGYILALVTGLLALVVSQLPLPALIGSRVALVASIGMVIFSTMAWRRKLDEQ